MFSQITNPSPAAGVFDIIWGQVDQVLRAPASLCVLLGWIVLAYVLEIWPDFPSKWIPVVTIIGSAVSYPLFCPTSSVTMAAPCKVCVLIVNGLVCGVAASVLHRYALKALIKRFGLAQDENPSNPNDQNKP